MKRIYVLYLFLLGISYKIGYKIGCRTRHSPKATDVQFSYHKDVVIVDKWYFPCSVVVVKITERNENDESLSNQLIETIKKNISENQQASITCEKVPVFARTINTDENDMHCFKNAIE